VGENKLAESLVKSWAADDDPGRSSLLKRCILLVKAWGYYEARLLGAHHSLLSSYTLEIMVLYVLVHYHEVARSPLSLLLTFLDVYSRFDWSGHALSMAGPVPLPALQASCNPGAHPSLLLAITPRRVLRGATVGAVSCHQSDLFSTIKARLPQRMPALL
jgi:hypothetical protein